MRDFNPGLEDNGCQKGYFSYAQSLPETYATAGGAYGFGKQVRYQKILLLVFLVIWVSIFKPVFGQKVPKGASVYNSDNLFAWSIVPFDSKNRNTTERIQMLKDLGITRFAYDWRKQHVATFDEELDALKKNNIKLDAFWLPTGADPANDPMFQEVLALLKRHNVKTQLWCVLSGGKDFETLPQEEKMSIISKKLEYIAKRAEEIGCSIGIYNYSGWFGQPENQLAVIEHLNMSNVGIIFNFNHAEEHFATFAKFFPKIIPHLYAINLSGIRKGPPAKIVPIGQGDVELEMMRIVAESKYRGPMGIINEYTDPDAEVGLRMNIEGLKKNLKALGYTSALKTYK